MKKRNTTLVLLLLGLLLFNSFEASSQDHNWYNSLCKLLKYVQRSQIEDLHGLDKISEKKEVRRLAISNINKHFEKVAKLRRSGKSEEEIRAYFNPVRKAAGTGSISGMVYESDGETPVQDYISIWAFNEYGQYSGYAWISSWDNGAYIITELSTDKYYVKIEGHGRYINEYYDNVTDWRDATLVPVTNGQETTGINFALDYTGGEGAVSGQVFGADGTPLLDCYVTVYDENYNEVNYGFTDENGFYTVVGLPSGGYKLQVQYWGSENYAGEWYDNAQSFETATVVTVTEPDTTENINFILDYDGAIEGIVFDSTGEPVGVYDCYVIAYDSEKNWISAAHTEENGNFTILKLKTGVYRLSLIYSGQGNYLDGWYDGADDFDSATPIAVTAPETTGDVYITLKAGGAIEGRVFDSTGEPVGYECHINVYDSDKNCISYASTEENGSFVIPKLKTGFYRLNLFYWGQGNCMDGWYDGAEDFDSATPIAVTAPGTTGDVYVTLQAGGSISGTVFDYNGQPLGPYGWCNVIAYDEHQNQVGTWAYVGENGHYTILRLPTGRYKIYAEYSGHTPTVGEEPVSEWYDGEYEFEDAKFVEVTAPDTTENIDFSLKRGGYIQGRVYGPDGQILSYSGEVNAYNLRGDLVGSQSVLNDGQYYITGLATQDYKLRFVYYGEEDYENEWYNGKQSFETANSVGVTAPNVTPNINFTLEYPGILQGFITDSAGNRLVEEEYFLHIYAYDANTGEYIDFDTNSFVGGYRFKLLGRDYKLAAVNYYGNGFPMPKNLAATYYEYGTSFNDPNTQTVSLEPASTLKLNDLVMEQADGAISGTIYDECNGQPVTEGYYIVFAFDEDGYLAAASVYSEFNAPVTGEYQIYGLKPGKYYVLGAISTDSFMDLLFQWYSGIEAAIDSEIFVPKVTIPANASAITVGEGLTDGIDFNFRITYKYSLILTASGRGTTDPSLGTHTCCEEEEVTITAIPKTDFGFSHWSGDIPQGYETDNPLTITVDSDKSITANFVQLRCALNISADTGGTTDPSPGSYKYDTGTQVSVTALPNGEYQFSGWTGDASGTTNPITVSMDSDKSITANFQTSDGDGGGGSGTGDGDDNGGGGCFIATAAYDSPLHPYVETLRDFRDKYLMRNKFGRRLIATYYKYSPFLANSIVRYKPLKIAARVYLFPVIVFCYSMLHLGLTATLVLFIFIAVFPILITLYFQRR